LEYPRELASTGIVARATVVPHVIIAAAVCANADEQRADIYVALLTRDLTPFAMQHIARFGDFVTHEDPDKSI
jgi:hypothetical protein